MRHSDTLVMRKNQATEERKYVGYLYTSELGRTSDFFLYDMYTCEDICLLQWRFVYIIYPHSAIEFSSSKQCHLKINTCTKAYLFIRNSVANKK